MTWTVAPLFGIHSPWNWIVLTVVVAVIGVAVLVLFQVDKRAPSEPARRRRRRSRA
jgi:hypothetical protein